MKYYILYFLIAFSFFNSNASDEKARTLVHALSYIEGDYAHAVKEGKILDEVEYAEMLEFSESIVRFYTDFSTQLSPEDTLRFGVRVRKLYIDVRQKETPDSVTSLASFLKNEFIRLGKVSTAPTAYPDIVKGATIYQSHCANCHGEKGFGDGKDAIDAVPAARNFHDLERMSELSPFAIFNTVRLGIEGTLMKPHPVLSDKEVWDVSFYVLSMRLKSQTISEKSIANVPLSDIASLNDNELKRKFQLSQDELAALRLQPPSQANNAFLIIASANLDKALAAYKNADYKQALTFATSAYLEGVEAIEMPLKSADPLLAEKLEKEMMYVRIVIKNQVAENEVEQAVENAKQTIVEASNTLGKKEYSFAMAFWMTLAILLREGLEAFLVIMAILAVLNKADLRHQKKFVHIGWAVAIVLGFAMWFLSGKLLSIGFAKIEILEGAISLTAVAMLLYIGFWLHGKSNAEAWKKYVGSLVKTATGNGSSFGLVAISFFVVFREVFESVLFLSALNVESKGTQTAAIGVGFIIALAIVVVLAVIALKFSAKIPIQQLFRISSVMMSLLAVVLVGKGVRAFQETGLIDAHFISFPKIELLGIYPTIETLSAQVFILILVAILWRVSEKLK